MKALVLGLLVVGVASAGQKPQTFTGTISDDMCAVNGHGQMRMGPTDADCTKACVSAHGAEYVLVEGKTVYMLSNQQAPERFAGQRVRVVGTLESGSRTIRVDSIAPAE